MSDFADREAAAIIDLCRSLSGAPADLHGIIAAKLRAIHNHGRLMGTMVGPAKVSASTADEVPDYAQDGFTPPRETTR